MKRAREEREAAFLKKNKELWQRLDAALANHEIEWHWVKGHSGHVENELVDQAANAAIDAMQTKAQ